MDDSASFSDENDAQQLLEKHEEILNELLDQMDKLQSEVDDYTLKINSMDIELTKYKQEEAKLRIINKNLNFEPNRSRQNVMDDESFNEEHLNLLKSKRNEISRLSEEIDKVKMEIQPVDDLVSDMQRENAILLCQKSDIHKQMQSNLSKKKRLNQDLQMARERLKELDINILNQQRLTKDTEIVVAGLITRLNATISQTDPNSLRAHSIKAMQSQQDYIQARTDEMSNTIQQYQDDQQECVNEIQAQIDTVHKKINWEREQDKLKNEYLQVTQEVKEAQTKSKQINAEIEKLRNRKKKLDPIIKKWESTFRGKTVVDSDESEKIDKLLTECNKLQNSSNEVKDRSSGTLESLAVQNCQLETQISKMQERLARDMAQFDIEKNQLKNQIRANRTSAFEKEHSLIEQIKVLNVKIARLKAKK